MHLLETVGTFMGEGTLAAWLREPASPEMVRERQSAVMELAPQIDLRDELTWGRLMGDEKPDPAPFLEWAEAEPWLEKRRWLPWAAVGSVALFWGLAFAQVFGVVDYPFWFLWGGQHHLYLERWRRHIYERIAKASAGEQGFKHYAGAFELLSKARFESAEMKRCRVR